MMRYIPFDIKIKYNSLLVDGYYQSVITIVSYEQIEFFSTIEKILNEMEMQVTFHIKRQSTTEFLKKLSTVIVTSDAEIKSINNNQIDNEILQNTKIQANEIKRKIQIDDEQVYLVETYIKLYAETEKELMLNVRKLVNLLYVAKLTARPCNFRQLEAYLSMLPFAKTKKLLSKYTENIFTSESLSMLFPFFTTEIFNQEGVILGKANNCLCKLSLLSENNLNYNMCVFGSSGAGKSYYIKLNILRHLYKGTNQIIIDPEGEYVELVKFFGGQIYTLDTYNPLYIDEKFANNNEDFFQKKINMTQEYLKERFGYKIKDTDIKVIKKLYERYGIGENKQSLYISGTKEKIYIKSRYKEQFPKLQELLNELNIDSDIKNIDSVNKTTNLTCIHIKSQNIDDIRNEMKIFIPKIYEMISENTLIYFDEIWKCISMGTDKSILEEIYNMFKTLRKRKTGIVAISQDIGDLFSLDNGNFGKSILNNSYTKVFFKLEYSDTEKLINLTITDELIKSRVFSLDRGSAYVKQGNANFILKVMANEYENNIIKGEIINEESIGSNRE